MGIEEGKGCGVQVSYRSWTDGMADLHGPWVCEERWENSGDVKSGGFNVFI